MADEPPPQNTPPGETDKPNTTDTEQLKSDFERLKEQMSFIREQLPKATIEKPTGAITVTDKFGYLVEPVTYAVARKAASAIKEKVQKKLEGLEDNSKILIVDHLDSANNDLVYIEIMIQFRVFDTALTHQITTNRQIIKNIEKILEQKTLLPIGAALLAAPYAVNAVAEIASYFRTDYTLFGRDFKVSSDALITAVAGELVTASSSRNIFIYNNYLLDLLPVMTYDRLKNGQMDLDSLTFSELVTLYCDLVHEAAQSQATLKFFVEKFKATTNADLKELLGQASLAVNGTDAILKSASEFFKGVSTIETGQTRSKMGSALIRDKIRRIGGKPGITHLLAITIPSSGGDTIAMRKFLHNSTKYLGGLVISFVLASVTGEILAADTVSYYGLINFDLKSSVPDEFTCKELRETPPATTTNQDQPRK